jgi:hypothetical protein
MTVSKCVKGRLCPSQRNNTFESKRLAEQSGSGAQYENVAPHAQGPLAVTLRTVP